MDKKNLLLIVPKLDQGGLERVCVRTARMLAPWFHITIAAFDPSHPAYDLEGLDVRNLHAPAAPGRAGKVLRVLQRAHRLRRLKKELHTDIAYSFGPTANRANVAAGGPGEIWCGLRSSADLEKEGELRLIAKKADRLICCSKVLAEEAEEKCGISKSWVLYNPFRMDQLEEQAGVSDPTIPDWEGKQVFMALGREDRSKGFWHLLKAFSLIHQKMPDTRLAIVGAGSFEKYKRLAAELGIADVVCMPGLKKNPFPWLKRADLYTALSIYEGFPNAMVEAMALGTPVICTNCMTGPAEILTEDYRKALEAEEILEGDYGVLIPPANPVENFDPRVITEREKLFAEEVERLLSDPAKLSHYAGRAKQRARKFSEEAYIEQFLKIAGMKRETAGKETGKAEEN